MALRVGYIYEVAFWQVQGAARVLESARIITQSRATPNDLSQLCGMGIALDGSEAFSQVELAEVLCVEDINGYTGNIKVEVEVEVAFGIA